MRARTLLGGTLLLIGLFAAAASATHFDNNPNTGSFNPQLTVSISQTLVNRPTQISLTFTQEDHEDPPVISRLRSPGDWQFNFTGTRQAQRPGGINTTDCDEAIDNDGNSDDGTGIPPNTDFSHRGDAIFVRAEKMGTAVLKAHADGVSRPGNPIVWNGDVAFISYDAGTQTAQLCALFITTDSRVVTIPDPSPGNGRDDVEGIVEIIGQFPVKLISDGGNQYWETLVDLTDLIQEEALQTVHASVLELGATLFANSVGNWQIGGPIVFSRSSLVSGLKTFQGIFRTCPLMDPAYGQCRSGRPDVIRTSEFTLTLPAPTITAPPEGALLNTNPVPISGTSDPFASVQVFEGNTPVGVPGVADAAGLWTAFAPLPDGPHTVRARTVDAGGQSPLSNARSFVLDTTPPAPPVITVPAQNAVIAGTSVTISGTAEVGSTVEVREGATTLITTLAGPTGTWSGLAILPKGPHQIMARATDIAGNTGVFGPLRLFSVTTAVPSIVAPTEGGHTNQDPVVITGVSEPNASVLVTENGIAVGPPALATPAGLWTMSVSFSEASHVIVATATEGGFESPPTGPRTFTVDFTAPLAPVIELPAEGSTVRSFLVPVSGTSEPFAAIGVFEGPTRIGSATADVNGDWLVNITMADGAHVIRANATDRAGNLGPSSPDRSFLVQDPLAILDPLQGSFRPGRVTISGTSDPLATEVRIYENQVEIGRAPSIDGEWELTLIFRSGTHTIRARSVTPSGIGPESRPTTFRVDADAPIAHIDRPSGYLLVGRLINTPLTGDAIDARPTDSLIDRIEVTYVDLFLGTETTRSIACSCPDDRVEFSDAAPLLPGLYEVTVTVYDVVGNSSTDSLFLLIV